MSFTVKRKMRQDVGDLEQLTVFKNKTNVQETGTSCLDLFEMQFIVPIR